MLVRRRSVRGQMLAKSSAFVRQVQVAACTMFHRSNDILAARQQRRKTSKRKRLASSTLASAAPTKKRTCDVKSKTSNTTTQSTTSSKTLDQDSTSNAKACVPFWNKCSVEWSKKLWLPTKTACVDTAPSYWSSSLSGLARNSWFTVTQLVDITKIKQGSLQMTSLPSPQCLWRVTTDGGRLKTDANGKPEIKKIETDTKHTEQKKQNDDNATMRAHKIRIYPTKQQKKTLSHWFGSTRWTYNRCVAAINAKTCRATKKELRAYTINALALAETDFKWALGTPYDVRDEGMSDVLKAIETSQALKKAGHIKKWKLGFRCKKDKQQSITILKKHWGRKRGVYSAVLGCKVLRSPESLPPELEADSRLIRTRLGHYYLALPMRAKVGCALFIY